uniref:Uncharacterized protein n=1 Tax=Cyprinodon variegatus TaxID=28743 RepID=A0A3Q2EKK4_CYPVA
MTPEQTHFYLSRYPDGSRSFSIVCSAAVITGGVQSTDAFQKTLNIMERLKGCLISIIPLHFICLFYVILVSSS